MKRKPASKKAPQPEYVCSACGKMQVAFRAECGGCGAFSTYITIAEARARGLALPIGLGDAESAPCVYMETSIVGLDVVASSGPGLVRGCAYLVTGGPGAGKSTLLVQAAVHLAKAFRVTYAFLEPGEDFINRLALRLHLDMSGVRGVSADSVDQLIARIGNCDVAILDSLQGLSRRSGEPIDTITHRLAEHGHETGTTWLLIGHINKDGDTSGVMAIEHWVDTTIHLSREHGRGLRVLSAGKNRNGKECVSFLRMTEGHGLVDVPDASSYLLADRSAGEVGSCVGVVLVEGWQGTASKAGVAPVLIEVQALTALIDRTESGKLAHPPRIVASGVEGDRMRLILDVLKQRAGVDVSEHDVTVNVCGDLTVKDRGLEVPVALAVASAVRGQPLPADLCAWGEIDLTGRVRGVVDTEARRAEAKNAQFGQVVHQGHLREAIDALLIKPESTKLRPRATRSDDAREPDAGRDRAVRVPAAAGGRGAKGARRPVRAAPASR